MSKECSTDNCSGEVSGRGYCKSCYMKRYRLGEFKDVCQRERHGMNRAPEYKTWDKMKQRCHNPNHNRFHLYGLRGIAVCAEWKASFSKFFEDMGRRPEGYTLDRIDPDKGYFKENCRWASISEQNANKRKKKGSLSTIKGVRKCGNKWRASICCAYKSKSLGSFDNLFDAACARKSAELERQKIYDKNRAITTEIGG